LIRALLKAAFNIPGLVGAKKVIIEPSDPSRSCFSPAVVAAWQTKLKFASEQM